LQCTFATLTAGSTATIDIGLTTSAVGTFTSNITLQAANDSNLGNNSASVAITVNAPAPPPSGGGGSSSGGGGGGGRMEWLALAYLGLLAMRRALRDRQTLQLRKIFIVT
jgi:hypothetical protein